MTTVLDSTITAPTTVREALIAGKAEILARGWWTSRMPELNGGVCAAVALHRSLGVRPGDILTHEHHLYEAAREALIAALPEGWELLTRFNDAETTTKADVLALYDRAIAASEVQA